MKLIFKILVTLIVILTVLFLGRNIIVKSVMETSMEVIAGAEMRVHKVNIDPFKTQISLTGIQVFNPKGFNDDVMVDIPEIFVDYDFSALTKGVAGFDEIRFHLKEFNVVKNADDQINIKALKPLQEKEMKEDKTQEEKPTEASKKQGQPEFLVKKFILRVDEVNYITINASNEENIQRFPIKLKEEMSDIDNPDTLVRVITYKALLSTTIAQLSGFDLKGLGGVLKGKLGDTIGSVSEVGGKTIEKATGLFKGITDTIKSTTTGE